MRAEAHTSATLNDPAGRLLVRSMRAEAHTSATATFTVQPSLNEGRGSQQHRRGLLTWNGVVAQ